MGFLYIRPPSFLVKEGRLHILLIGYFKNLYKQLKGIGSLLVFIKLSAAVINFVVLLRIFLTIWIARVTRLALYLTSSKRSTEWHNGLIVKSAFSGSEFVRNFCGWVPQGSCLSPLFSGRPQPPQFMNVLYADDIALIQSDKIIACLTSPL